MKSNKNLWLFASLLAAMVLLVAACSGAAPADTTEDTAVEDTADADTAEHDDGDDHADESDMDMGGMCMGAEAGSEVSILYIWSGAEEESFQSIVAPVLEDCGITLVAESSRDNALLDTRIESGNPYDIVIWSTTGPMVSYTDQLMPLDQVGAYADNYSDAWKASANGEWLAVGMKADPKSLVWYSPVNFDALGYTVPTTWDEFTALADQMAADGNVPFAMGFESGDATGWTASDFIQDILLATQGPDYVFGLLDGSIPYDDAGVVEAYEIYAAWATDPAYAVGGADGSLSTSFADAILQPFSDPPQAMMVKQSGFAGGAVAETYPELEYGTDYAFFGFPGAQGVQSGADWLMVFSDTPAVHAIVAYLTSTEGGAAWAQSGFGLSPNNGSAGNYTNATSANLAAVLANAAAATPDLGDSIQPTFFSAEWQAIVDVISGASSAEAALEGAAAAQAADLAQ